MNISREDIRLPTISYVPLYLKSQDFRFILHVSTHEYSSRIGLGLGLGLGLGCLHEGKTRFPS